MDKSTKLVVFAFCVLKLALLLTANYHSGFQGDELLHIQTGNHLAWGYMEFPPVIGWLAFIQNLFNSDSVFVHRIFPVIASVLIFVFVSKTVIALGGKARAVFLVLLCLLPVMGRSHLLLQPVVFSQLFWVISFYNLTQYVKLLDKKYLWYLTFSVALGFLSKYDAVFFIFGLLSLLFFKTTREALVKHKFWWNVVVFLLLISPNLIWQYVNDFPVLKMFSRLYEAHLEVLTPAEVLGSLVLALNPITLLVYIPALVSMFSKNMRAYRPVCVAIWLSTLFLAFSKGKAYYFYPIVLTILPFGGVFWDSFFTRKYKWGVYPLAVLLILSGAVYLPLSYPLTSLESYIENEYKYEKKDVPGSKYAIKEERYSKQKWHETLTELQKVYENLPANERETAVIWGKHYGQAGAIDLMGEKYKLPKAFSLHGSFYLWLPKGEMPNTVIAIRYSDSTGTDFFEPFFEEVEPVKSIYNPYSDEAEEVYQTIFICRKPKQDFDGLKAKFANRIFE